MISFDDAIEHGILNKEVLKLTKGFCKCGTQLFIDNSYRRIICPNEDCKERFIESEQKLCKYIGFDIGHDELDKINTKYNIISQYQLLQLDELYSSGQISESDVHDIESYVQKIKEFKNRELFIYELFEMSGLDIISNVAYNLFFGFNSVKEVYDEIDKSQVIFINERLGFNNKSISISVMLYKVLENIRESMFYVESMFKIKQYENRVMIAFNDDIGDYLNRTEFMELINEKYNRTFVMVTLITENTDIIIMNSWNKTYKIRKADEINDNSIAKMLNNNDIDMIEIGKFNDKQLKPYGKQIYIDSLNNVLERFDMFYME